MLQDALDGIIGPRAKAHREVVLRVLEELPGPSTAYAIYNHTHRTGARIGMSTIYRHLASLVEAGTAGTIRDHAGRYLYYLRSGDEHTFTLMCARCGRGIPVDTAVVARWAMENAVNHGFSDVRLSATVTGVCPRCQATAGPSD